MVLPQDFLEDRQLWFFCDVFSNFCAVFKIPLKAPKDDISSCGICTWHLVVSFQGSYLSSGRASSSEEVRTADLEWAFTLFSSASKSKNKYKQNNAKTAFSENTVLSSPPLSPSSLPLASLPLPSQMLCEFLPWESMLLLQLHSLISCSLLSSE